MEHTVRKTITWVILGIIAVIATFLVGALVSAHAATRTIVVPGIGIITASDLVVTPLPGGVSADCARSAVKNAGQPQDCTSHAPFQIAIGWLPIAYAAQTHRSFTFDARTLKSSAGNPVRIRGDYSIAASLFFGAILLVIAGYWGSILFVGPGGYHVKSTTVRRIVAYASVLLGTALIARVTDIINAGGSAHFLLLAPVLGIVTLVILHGGIHKPANAPQPIVHGIIWCLFPFLVGAVWSTSTWTGPGIGVMAFVLAMSFLLAASNANSQAPVTA